MKIADAWDRARTGFSLIELLAVIAVISILAALIIPALSHVRSTAHNAQCASNLRQIALAVNTYAVEHGQYPFSRTRAGQIEPGTTLWRQFLAPYFGGEATPDYANPVYVCPARGVIPEDRYLNVFPAYALHPRICPDSAVYAYQGQFVTPGQIERPGEIILVADATQQSSGQSHTNFYGIVEAASDGSLSDANSPIAEYTDPDPDAEKGAVFRYRHDGHANVAFVDGHIGSFERGEIKERNVRINY